MLRIIISIFFGMIPEVLYFTFFLIYAKDIKQKKTKLFFGILLAYIVCLMIIDYKLIYYICFVCLIYLILKILYKEKAQITDIFLFSLSTLYLTILSFLILFVRNQTQYIFYLILNRFLLILPFVFKDKFYKYYKKYYSLWNRNKKQKRPIKSITLRNVSLILIDIIILLVNIICLYLTNFIESR